MTIQDPAHRELSQQPNALVLIEPDGPTRQRMAAWLADLGLVCTAVAGPAQAVELLRAAPVGPVLMSAAAPGGLDALKPSLAEGQPVLVYGCLQPADQRVAWQKAGAEDAVSCDGPGEELALRVEALMRLWSLGADLTRCRLQFRQNLLRERKMVQRVRRRNRRLREMALTDPLTGLNNVRYFRQWLATQFEIARRYKLLMSVLMIDIDGLKRINDSCGHPFGDYVLSRFGQILREQVRSSDVVARVGGDEFVAGLVETGRQDAVRFARRLLRAVASSSFECYGQTETITISVGQACLPEDAQVKNAEQLILFADQALYKAKATGRNSLACWHELDADLRLRLASARNATPSLVFSRSTLCLNDET